MNRVTKLIMGLFDSEAPRPNAAVAAELAARVMDGATAMDGARETTATLAARLDGGLDEEAQARLDRAFAAASQDYQNLAAAAELVGSVAGNLRTAPADLLAGAAALAPPAKPARSRRIASWLWAGGAVLAAALAAFAILRGQIEPTDGKAPLLAAPEQTGPQGEGGPRLLPAGNEDVVPLKPGTPTAK